MFNPNDPLSQKIHDIVNSATQPVNANQIFQILNDHMQAVTIEQVRREVLELASRGILIDANLPSYFAIG